MIYKTIKVKKIYEKNDDYIYWNSKSPEERLGEVENLRKEYNGEDYASKQRLQRVYRVIKQK